MHGETVKKRTFFYSLRGLARSLIFEDHQSEREGGGGGGNLSFCLLLQCLFEKRFALINT
jgi:hypothetical protein